MQQSLLELSSNKLLIYTCKLKHAVERYSSWCLLVGNHRIITIIMVRVLNAYFLSETREFKCIHSFG